MYGSCGVTMLATVKGVPGGWADIAAVLLLWLLAAAVLSRASLLGYTVFTLV